MVDMGSAARVPWLLAALAVLPAVIAVVVSLHRTLYRHWLTFLGISAAGIAALFFDVEIPRLAYGGSRAVFLALECASLLGVVSLVLLLRSRLTDAAEPRGLYRDALDFLALTKWHPATTCGLGLVIVLPLAWIAVSDRWVFGLLSRLGREAFAMSDVRNVLDSFAVVLQHSLTAGLPLLLVFHVGCRRWFSGRYVPWLLLPLLLVGTAIGMIISVTLAHFAG